MNIFFAADYVLPITGEAIKDGVVEVTTQGVIRGIYHADDPIIADRTINKQRGIIIPGFVNAHCHLELSHLKGMIPKSTGLVPFLQQVMTRRASSTQIVKKAMERADKQLYDRGIVAVGDHANTSLSAPIKAKSKIHYHTFVEVLGFEPEVANEKFADALAIASQFDKQSVSITAHAPYSVSKELFKLLNEHARKQGQPLSIHNQETEDENKLFRYKSGKFIDFYDGLGKDISAFKAQARSSLQTILSYLSRETSVMLVHNTFTTAKDIFFIDRQGKNVTWCFCPNANLYIEGILPKVDNFIRYGHPITIGTDSLASNDSLCILAELKTIHQHFPNLPLTETIKWATINGACLLGIAEKFGSLEKGKSPGLNLLTRTEGLSITADTDIIRLI